MQRHNILESAAGPLTQANSKAVDKPELFVRDWGTGNPVLFLHGWGLTSDSWRSQMLELANAGFRAIAFDQRGHGRSSDPGKGYDIDTLASDLSDMIERFDLHGLTLVGHSMGNSVIVRYLSRFGSRRIGRLVMVSPVLPLMLKTADNPNGIDQQLLEGQRAFWKSNFDRWLNDNGRPFLVPETPEETLVWLKSQIQQASLKALVDLNREICEVDYSSEVRDVSLPTLIVHGDQDQSAPLELTAAKCARMIQGSELKIYAGGPHGLFLTHAERFNCDLLAFLGARRDS